MKDLFKSFEFLCKCRRIQIGSKGEEVFVLGGLRKKSLARCQILLSNYHLYTVQQKVFFKIVKESFKSIDLLRRSGKIKKSSNRERIFILGGLTKKYSARCQILRSKYYL